MTHLEVRICAEVCDKQTDLVVADEIGKIVCEQPDAIDRLGVVDPLVSQFREFYGRRCCCEGVVGQATFNRCRDRGCEQIEQGSHECPGRYA